MKALLSLFGLFILCTSGIQAQDQKSLPDGGKIVVDNQKLRVTEYTSIPDGNVCGKGVHRHPAHLTTLLTEAEVEIVLPDGKTVTQKLPAGASFWSEAGTHAIKNIGKNLVRVQLIELKDGAAQ